MEIKDYISMVRRWAWLLAAGFLLGALGGLLWSLFQTPIYQASTRLLVLRASQAEKNTDTYLSDQQLVQTYIQLLTTRSALEGASGLLGYEVSAKQVSVQQIGDMQAIQLTVEDANAQHAADIANSLVQVLILQNEVIQTGRYKSIEQSIQAQITQIENQMSQMGIEIENVSTETVQQQLKQVEEQIANMQSEVSQLQNDIRQLTPPGTDEQKILLSEKEARLNQIQPILTLSQQIYTDLVVLGKPSSSQEGTNRLSQLQTTMKLYQEIYINLLNNLEAIRLSRLQNTPNVVSIEAAVVPEKPVRPKPLTYTGLAAVVGLLFAAGTVFLIEYFDDTIQTPEDIDRILKLPIIGYIGEINFGKGEVVDVHVLKHPRSPISEAFRGLRTNLEFTNVDQSLKKILITSSGPGEGKSTIASNLAAIMAQGGKRVLLIDADMRRPRVHEIFKITNHVGLSNLFRGGMPLSSVMRKIPGAENLLVIPSGSLPPNPTELLASSRMDQILLDAGREVDVIIIDSPPSLVADYQVLSTKMDGVLLVVQPGTTRADSASTMLSQLERVKAVALGVVLNRISRNNRYYGGSQYYAAYSKGENYYSLEEKGQPQKQLENPVRSLPTSETDKLNSDRVVTNINEIPVELLLSKEEQSIITNSKAVIQPIESPSETANRQIPIAKVHKDVLEEMYNEMKKNKS